MSDSISVLIDLALSEDLANTGDVTSNALFGNDAKGNMAIVSRSKGILSGVSVASEVFKRVDSDLKIKWSKNDGDLLKAKDVIATITGSLSSILKAERTVLNFLCHLSGVATLTHACVEKLDKIGSTTKIRDTRKTTPAYRALEKQAVVDGGGVNHRMGLYDAFLVKDNHLQGASIEVVVAKCRAYNAEIPLEVEVDSIEQLEIVAKTKPDLILLDNFTPEMVKEALAIGVDIPFEISGGITLDTIEVYGKTNVKYIAVGAITHSAPILDLGFDIL